MARAVLLLPLVLHHSAAFSLLAQQRTNAATAMRGSDDDAIDASSADAFIAGLMNRVGDLKSRQLELPIVVLDATLPNQQLAISTSDQAFREMIEYCGVKAVEEAGDEQFDDQRHGRFLCGNNLQAIEKKGARRQRRVDGLESPRRRADATETTSRPWHGAPEI